LGSVSSLVSEKKIFEISANQSILLATGTKNRGFVEDHPRNIPAKFGSNWPSGFGEEACLQTTDNRQQTMDAK
jgi:hypothetical protein